MTIFSDNPYVFFFALFNLRNLLYLTQQLLGRKTTPHHSKTWYYLYVNP